MPVFTGVSNGQRQLLGTFLQEVNCICAFDLPALTTDNYLDRLGLMLVCEIPSGLNPRTMNTIKVFGSGLLFRPAVLFTGLGTGVFVDWYISGISWKLATGTL